MKTSILMPVFNASEYLHDCLNSILDQTEIDWELLVVNDFSKDNSNEILINFAKKDERISVLQNNKKGIIPALQLAFQNSTGQLITRMDADDKMAPKKLATLKSNLLKKGTGYLATGCVKYFSETGLGGGYLRYEQWLNGLTKNDHNFSEIYKECVIPSPCWMLYRNDLIQCGAFDSSIYPEDYDLCFRFYENQLNIVGTDQVLHYWRDYPERSSRTMEEYSNNHYFDLKLPYFLKLDWDKTRTLTLWGAGKKGKRLAKMLREKNVPFHWVCNNSRKWGIELFGTKMKDFESIKTLDKPQVIIAVGSPEGQSEILEYLEKQNIKVNSYFFFT